MCRVDVTTAFDDGVFSQAKTLLTYGHDSFTRKRPAFVVQVLCFHNVSTNTALACYVFEKNKQKTTTKILEHMVLLLCVKKIIKTVFYC